MSSLIILSTLIWLVIIMVFVRKGHVAFVLMICMIGAYELVGQFYLQYLDENYSGVNVNAIISDSVALVDRYIVNIITTAFFIVYAVTYAFCSSRSRRYPIFTTSKVNSNVYSIVVIGVLLFGLVSFVSNAGAVAQLDYLNEATEQTRIPSSLSYGQILLIVIVALIYSLIKRSKWIEILFISLFAMPLLTELFIAGRRQAFLPAFVLLLLLANYDKSIIKKWVLNVSAILSIIVAFAIQFSLRTGSEGSSLLALAYQFSELPLVHATTLNSYSYANHQTISLGSQYIVAALNSFPYLSIGDVVLNTFNIQPWIIDSRAITPLGGLSMIGDSMLAFGVVGPLLFALALGVFTNYTHQKFIKFSSNTQFIYNDSFLAAVSAFAIFVTYYRNGFSHYIKYIISFFILYYFFVGLRKMLKLSNTGEHN